MRETKFVKNHEKMTFSLFLFSFFLHMALVNSFYLIILQFTKDLKNIIKHMHIDFWPIFGLFLTVFSPMKKNISVNIMN